jgi:hypothetical protein
VLGRSHREVAQSLGVSAGMVGGTLVETSMKGIFPSAARPPRAHRCGQPHFEADHSLGSFPGRNWWPAGEFGVPRSRQPQEGYTPFVPRQPTKRPASSKECLRLTLDTPATPELVRALAQMFEETLRHIDPALHEGDVTMRVENSDIAAEIRGWREGGQRAVRLTAELVENPTAAVQKHDHLAAAARTLATHTAPLTPHRPTFWRGDKALRLVDDVFVRTMRAAGQTAMPRAEERLMGETVVYTAILRVGRTSEGGRLQARIRLEGRPVDVHVGEELVGHVWEVAKAGHVVPLRLRGQWVDSDTGDLCLAHAEIVGLDATFTSWTGRELLDEVKAHAGLFSADDFDRMLTDLQSPMRDE